MMDFNAIHPHYETSKTVIAAQQISRAIEQSGLVDVGAELSHGAAGTESFEIRDAFGNVYRVCVVPIPVHLSTEFKPS